MIVRKQNLLAFVLVNVITGLTSSSHSAELRLPVAVVSQIDDGLVKLNSTLPISSYSIWDSVAINRLYSVEVPEETRGSVAIDQFVGVWETGDTAIFRVEAAEGFKFRVTPHPEANFNTIHSYINFWNDGGPQFEAEPTVTFENLRGVSPTLNASSDDAYGIVGEIGRNISYGFTYDVTEPFTFTALEVSFVTGGPGEVTLNNASTTFQTIVAAGNRNELTDQRLFELVRIPEPSSALLLLTCLGLLGTCRRTAR